MSEHGNGKKGRKSHSLFPLGCGCKDMKSVSVCVPTTEMINKSAFRKNDNNISTSSWERVVDETERQESLASAPSFAGLLRELNELEQSVKDWGTKNKYTSPPTPPSFSSTDKSKERPGAGRLEKSIVIVKESDDPLDDFKKSMLQMIVENEIEGKDEMEELLQKFLLLNSIENHDVIVRAFTELWEEVFSEVEETRKLLLRRQGGRLLRHSRQVH